MTFLKNQAYFFFQLLLHTLEKIKPKRCRYKPLSKQRRSRFKIAYKKKLFNYDTSLEKSSKIHRVPLTCFSNFQVFAISFVRKFILGENISMLHQLLCTNFLISHKFIKALLKKSSSLIRTKIILFEVIYGKNLIPHTCLLRC